LRPNNRLMDAPQTEREKSQNITRRPRVRDRGGMESANKFICHVRLKRSGAWWYEDSSNQMLALRCAKYNGTFEHVFRRPPHQKADA